MDKLIKLLTSLLLFSGTLQAQVDNLSSEQLIRAQKQGVVIIDIRTPPEWKEVGVIPGSHKIMYFDENRDAQIPEFMAEFKKIVVDKDQPFILVCRTGHRTSLASKYLNQEKGYTHAAHLAKGINNWIAEGRDVIKK
jgi:rhodanese-related sulfurtransferase